MADFSKVSKFQKAGIRLIDGLSVRLSKASTPEGREYLLERIRKEKQYYGLQRYYDEKGRRRTN